MFVHAPLEVYCLPTILPTTLRVALPNLHLVDKIGTCFIVYCTAPQPSLFRVLLFPGLENSTSNIDGWGAVHYTTMHVPTF